jgi:hypothetical protein
MPRPQRPETNPLVINRRPTPDRPTQQTRPSRSVNASPDSSRRSRLRLRSCPQSASNSWCTGKDSNLRTSLGGTDLQSVGFNHSPTCAKTPSLPGPITQVSIAGDSMRSPMLQAGGCPIEKQSARENPLARKHHTWKNSLWSAVGKKSVTPPRRAKPYIPEPILRIKPIKCWSWRRDLNPRPSDYKSDALPTELRQQSETTGPRGRIYPSDPFQMSGTIAVHLSYHNSHSRNRRPVQASGVPIRRSGDVAPVLQARPVRQSGMGRGAR